MKEADDMLNMYVAWMFANLIVLQKKWQSRLMTMINYIFYYTARVQYEDRFPWYSQISPLIPVSELGNRILIVTVMAYGQTAVSIYRQICKFDFFRVFIET